MAGEVREIDLAALCRDCEATRRGRARYTGAYPDGVCRLLREVRPARTHRQAARLKPERRMELDLDVKFLIGQINSLTARQGTLERTSKDARRFDYVQVALLVVLILFIFGRALRWF